MTTPEPTPPAKPRKTNWLVETVVTIALALALYFVIQAVIVQTYRVEGHSMDDSLHDGQHLLIDKLTPRFDDYSRGDVVVLHPPDEPESSTPFIKRVIGVAGDHLELRDGEVWVNGTELDEPYTKAGSVTEPLNDETAWDVGQGEVFVMGDNREDSRDSREFGVVQTSEIIGRAWLRFWPLDTFGILPTPTYPELDGPTSSTEAQGAVAAR
ncbi:MAG: signal peptidase I [Chloroflexota bacterium]